MANTKDRIGMQYGRLTVLCRASNTDKKEVQWRCSCACGRNVTVRSNNLTSGTTKSCGCLQRERVSNRAIINLTGNSFGFLTVLTRAKHTSKYAHWKCKCKCDKIVVVSSHNLRSGKTTSCGCVKTAVATNSADQKMIDTCYRYLQKHQPEVLKEDL